MTIQLTFTPEVQKELNHERYHHPVPMVQRRMEALWLKSHGLPHEQIARLAGVSENTIRDYFPLVASVSSSKRPLVANASTYWAL
jgi:DNA-binding NarL/FixJ family response regulator